MSERTPPYPGHPDTLRYLAALFPGDTRPTVALRGVGEKGTDKFGRFAEPVLVPPSARVSEHLVRWMTNSIGCFIVPALLREGCGASPRDEDIAAYTSVLVDLDDEAIAGHGVDYLSRIIGPPSIIVASSGAASPKRHLYWLLDEPCEDPPMVAATRRAMAELCGGDVAFARLPQIIRIPGTLNQKQGLALPVELLRCDADARYSLDDIHAAIADADRPAWAPEPKRKPRASIGPDGLLSFSPDGDRARVPLTQDITEGGGPDGNRWSEFSRVAGHYINTARHSDTLDLPTARELAMGWMLAHMKPAWPDDRFNQEWTGLLSRDIETHGPWPAKTRTVIATRAPTNSAVTEALDNPLHGWAAHRWTTGDKPTRRWLVPGLVAARKGHLLVAEGGAGKTFAAVELAMKLAAPRAGDTWMGQPINAEAAGTVVVLTAEDDAEELHIRMADMDPDGSRRAAAGDRLIVIPLIDARAGAGGPFRLVERDLTTGRPKASQAYEETLGHLKALPDLRLVTMDTFASTLHGDENASIVVQEWAAAASRISGECGAAWLGTHHMRKADRARRVSKNAPPRTIEDVKEDIRGSNALSSAARMVLVMYQPDDWAERLEAMREPKRRGSLWRFGVAKANNPEAMRREKTLLRTSIGTLEDVTHRDALTHPIPDEKFAWLVWAIGRAEEAGFGYTATGPSGFFERRHELPLPLRSVSKEGFGKMVKHLLAGGQAGDGEILIVQGGRKYQHRLGVVGGAIHRASYTEAKGAPPNLAGTGYQYDPEFRAIKRDDE